MFSFSLPQTVPVVETFQNTNLVYNSFNLQQYVTLHSSTCFEQNAAHHQEDQCITTASGIVTLCKLPYSMQVESGLQSALHPHTVRLLTEGDDTRGCGDTLVLLMMSSVLLETC